MLVRSPLLASSSRCRFDSGLNQFGGVVDWTITDALTPTHDFKRV